MNEDKSVEFEVKFNNESITGYMYLSEANDEKPLRFYDLNNQEQWYVPSNPNDMDHDYDNWLDYEMISTTIGSCDLIQHLVDFADEHKEIILDKPTDGGEIILVINQGDNMSEYEVDTTNFLADTCHLIFRKTLIYDDEIVYDVFALVDGNEIQVGTVDNLEQVDRFIDEFQEKAWTKVLGKTIKDGYDDLKQDWR